MSFFGAEIPFCAHCGIEEVGITDGVTRLRVDVETLHQNNMGIAHGGLTCTLLDLAMGTAARTRVGVPVMTLDMHVTFLAPGRGALVAEGRVAKAGRSILFCEATVMRESDGEVVAKASGVFKPSPPRPEAAQPG